MKKHRLIYLAAVAAALFTYIMADRREPLVLLCFLLILPVTTLLIQIVAMRDISVRCEIPPVCRTGQDVPFTVTIEKKNHIPFGAIEMHMVIDNLMFGEKQQVTVSLQPGEEKEMQFEYLFSPEDCGAMKTGVQYIDYYDLLGLFRWHREAGETCEIQVYPPELRLNINLTKRPESRDFDEIYELYRKGHDVSEVIDLRNYVEGDPMHAIHWKLSGKLGHMIVREFGKPSNYQTLILYETTKMSGNKKLSNACNDAVLALTISLSYSMLAHGLEHNVGCVSGQELEIVPVHSMQTYEEMAAGLLYVPIPEKVDASETVFVFMRGNFRNQYTRIIYITPNYQEASMNQLAKTTELMVIHVAENQEMEYIDKSGYSIVPVNVNTYQSSMHNIDL